MLSEKLKLSTKTSHQQLEKMMVLRLRSITLTKESVSLLGIFFSYFGGIEILVEKFIDKKKLPDHLLRRKAASLAADIRSFGSAVPALQDDLNLPGINSHHAAMGALYVMEGSTLGGSAIGKMIRDKLGDLQYGLDFFNGYGDDTIKMWLLFKQSLDETMLTEAEENIVIRSADETFKKFGILLQDA
jgi:heme oxygenase